MLPQLSWQCSHLSLSIFQGCSLSTASAVFCRVLHCTAQSATVALRAMQQDGLLQQVLPRRPKVIEFPSIIIHLDVTYSRSGLTNKQTKKKSLDKQDFLKATGLFYIYQHKNFEFTNLFNILKLWYPASTKITCSFPLKVPLNLAPQEKSSWLETQLILISLGLGSE